MHLIFIRHADPDYSADSVTEKGRRELELLSGRISKMDITDAFVSPMGRAQVTAKVCLASKPSLKAKTLPWLREFSYPIKDPKTNRDRIPWDWLPRDWMFEDNYKDASKFFLTKAMKSGDIERHYNMVCNGFDAVLSNLGYKRLNTKIPLYICSPHITKAEAMTDTHLEANQKDSDPRNLIFFCHLGVMFVMLSHLTGISPVQLWQCFFVAPSSVTIAGTEERVPGEVSFRVQTFGDVSHLISNGEMISASGFYGNCLSV